jgi:hypothetical protein
MSTPPTPLLESYYSCRLDAATSLFNAVGISAGTTSLLITAMAIVLMPLIYMMLEVPACRMLRRLVFLIVVLLCMCLSC